MLVESGASLCVCVSYQTSATVDKKRHRPPLVNSPRAAESQALYLTSLCRVLSVRPFVACFDGGMNSEVFVALRGHEAICLIC